MNNELHIHRISSALAQIIYDTLTNQQNGKIYFSSHSIVVSAKMFLIDDEFTKIIAQIQLTSEMSPVKYVMAIERSSCWHIVLASCSRIQLLSLSKREDKGGIETTFKSLPNGYDLAALSKSLALSAADVMIAATKCGSLFVIVFKRTEKQKPSSLLIIKVNDQDRPNFLQKWFTKQKNAENISNELFLMRIDQYDNFFRLLSIKGEEIDLSIIHLSLQTSKASIRKTHTINLTNSLIRTPITFRQAVALSSQELVPREYEIVGAYQKQEQFITLVRISITIEQECKIYTSILSQFTPSQHFSMVAHNNALYYTYFDSIKAKYPLKKVRISKQESQTDAIHEFKQKIHFANGNQLYVLTPTQIFLVSAFHIYDSDDSQWLEDRDRMNVYFHQQIARQLQSSKYEAVAILLEEKISKLMQLIHGRSQEDKFQQEIEEEILCSVIIKTIFSSSNLSQLMENSQLKNLLLLASTCQTQNVRNLLQNIVNDRKYDYFIRVVMVDLMKMMAGKIGFDAIRQILTSPTTICLEKLKNEKDQAYLFLFKDLLEISIDFMAITTGHITYLINQKHSSFAKQIIVNNCIHEQFIRFFTNSLLRFTVEDLQTMANKLKLQGKSLLRLFVRRLLFNCKELQAKNINFMSQKLQLLVKGLLNHYDDLLDEINEYFPGLTFFFYLQARTKHEEVCIIHEMAIKCSTSSQINTLFLSILKGKNAQNDEITMTRICKYIGVKYYVSDSSTKPKQ